MCRELAKQHVDDPDVPAAPGTAFSDRKSTYSVNGVRPQTWLSVTVTRQFRLVGLLNEDDSEHHLYFTNLSRKKYSASDRAVQYRARWEVELLFKELKSWFGLDEINTTKPYIIEALIIMAAISLMISRVIVDELHKLDAKRREAADADCDESASRLPPTSWFTSG